MHDEQYQQELLSLGLSGLKVLQLDNIAVREEVLGGLNNMTGLHQLILFNIQPHLVRPVGGGGLDRRGLGVGQEGTRGWTGGLKGCEGG